MTHVKRVVELLVGLAVVAGILWVIAKIADHRDREIEAARDAEVERVLRSHVKPECLR